MRLSSKILSATIVSLASCLPAVASEHRVVPANRPSPILFYYTVTNDTCYSGAKPTVHITHDPAHGSISTAWKGFTMDKKWGHCGGKPMHGTLVVYRPSPGYHGSDRVSIVFSGSALSGYFVREKEFNVDIDVK